MNLFLNFRDIINQSKLNVKNVGYEWQTSRARNLLMSSNGYYPCKGCATIRNYKKDVSTLEADLIKKFGVCNYEFLTTDFTGNFSKKKIKVKCKKCRLYF